MCLMVIRLGIIRVKGYCVIVVKGDCVKDNYQWEL